MDNQWLWKKLNSLYNDEEKLKKELFNIKNEAITYIYSHGDILKKNLFDFGKEKYKRKDKSILIPLLAFIFRHRDMDYLKLSNASIKFINNLIRKNSDKYKTIYINSYLTEARKNGLYFYLASSHDDSALDHIDYQAKIYYDNRLPLDQYIYGYREIQWVMGSPVWFITRPYCRHYFVAITYEEAKEGDIEKLKRKYKTHRKVGNRRFQTPPVRNVALYEDRLRLLQKMYKVKPTLELKKQILKCKMLLDKWRSR